MSNTGLNVYRNMIKFKPKSYKNYDKWELKTLQYFTAYYSLAKQIYRKIQTHNKFKAICIKVMKYEKLHILLIYFLGRYAFESMWS